MSQILVPLAAWIDAMPSRATSDEVSKPRPKRMPSGYIFQGLVDHFDQSFNIAMCDGCGGACNGPVLGQSYRSMSLNIFLKSRNKHPAPCICNPSSSSPGPEARSFCICNTSLYRMYMFMTPRTIRKAADTEEPMMAPTLPKVANRPLTAEAVAATVMDVTITMLGTTRVRISLPDRRKTKRVRKREREMRYRRWSGDLFFLRRMA